MHCQLEHLCYNQFALSWEGGEKTSLRPVSLASKTKTTRRAPDGSFPAQAVTEPRLTSVYSQGRFVSRRTAGGKV